MNPQLLVNIGLGVVLILWIGSRQLTWQQVTPTKIWTIPALLTGAGIVLMVNQVTASAFTPFALTVMGVELVLSIAIGLLMGALATFRPLASAPGAPDAPRWETRTGWVGMALWIALIAMRIGIDVWAGGSGAGALVVSTGAILFVVGVNRFTRSATLMWRVARHHVGATRDARMMDA